MLFDVPVNEEVGFKLKSSSYKCYASLQRFSNTTGCTLSTLTPDTHFGDAPLPLNDQNERLIIIKT